MSFKRYDGSAWTDVATVKRYSGSAWLDCEFMRRWDGSAWVDVWTGKKMIYYTANITASYTLSNNVITITPTYYTAYNGKMGVKSNFSIAVGDVIAITYDVDIGGSGASNRKLAVDIGGTRAANVTTSGTSTLNITASTTGQLDIYYTNGGGSGDVSEGTYLTISNVTVNGKTMQIEA